MTRPSVTVALLALAATIAAGSPRASAAEWLSLPCGYFHSSGGFYEFDDGHNACYRYAPAGGCTIPMSYRAYRPQVFSADASDAPAVSWYAGEQPSYCDGPRIPNPGCPAPASVPHEYGEEVGPGELIAP
ncbi:MAG: hypothetical protein DWQ37_06705 [Planctomycetota bacterium]|nr:MAG: hypothetical protein DWQ37_06705 [Planctomycetota bacterium]